MSGLTRRQLIAATAIAAGLIAAPMTGIAQDYPTKPITMIIPLGPGGSHDLNARVMTSVLPTYLGQPVVVQLMPGASGRTGTAAAAKAPADGYTLLFTHNFIDELQQHISKVPYVPNKDFVAVARTNYAQPYLIVRNDSPFKDLKSLISFAKENPGKLKFGHSGNWGAFMVPGAALMAEAGIKATLVPYQGGGPVMQALLAGDVDFSMAFPSVFAGQEDKVRALAAVGDKSSLEGVPTTKAAGYDKVGEIGIMHRVVLAPTGVPEDRLAKLRAAFAKMTKDKTYQKLLQRLGENNEFMDGKQYDALRRAQSEQYAALVKELTK